MESAFWSFIQFCDSERNVSDYGFLSVFFGAFIWCWNDQKNSFSAKMYTIRNVDFIYTEAEAN